MIDVHCHLEQEDYSKTRDEVIKKCKKELKAVITSCAHPKYFDITMEMVDNHKNFIFASFGIHPEYVKEVSGKEIDDFLELINENKERVTAIGETGLDYWWTKETEWQMKQKELFIQFIELSKEIKKPLVIHCRDAFEDIIRILEENDAREVNMHMFGKHNLVNRIMENGWYISMNTIILRSKSYGKVIRDCPLERLMLETDAPWLAPQQLIEGIKSINDPTSIKLVAKKIAEIKELSFKEIWRKCGENAIKFFRLPIEV